MKLSKHLLLTSIVALTLSLLSAKTVDVRSCGAVGDGKTDDTAAIQRAIDTCAAAGGGTALVSAGHTYVTYTIGLKSNVRLEVERGAVLLGGTDPFKYPLFEPTPLWHVERAPRFNRRAMFYTCGQTNVTLCGGGIIDGNAEAFHHPTEDPEHWARNSHTNITGRCVFFVACRDVILRDVTIRNPSGWSMWFLDCDRVDIRNLTINADPRFPNGDGINIGACRDVTISDCVVHSQDDALILRAQQEQCRVPRPLERVLVNNCVLDSSLCATVRIGWCGDAPVRDCSLNNIISRNTSLGVEIWLPKHNDEGQVDPPRSAELREPPGMLPFAIENIRFSNMDMTCRRGPFAVTIAPEIRPKYIRNISFSNCRFKCAESPKIGKGAHPKDNLSDWSFDNVEFDIEGNEEATECPWFTHIRNLRMNNVFWNVRTINSDGGTSTNLNENEK